MDHSLERIYAQLCYGNCGMAIAELETYLAAWPDGQTTEALRVIKEEYQQCESPTSLPLPSRRRYPLARRTVLFLDSPYPITLLCVVSLSGKPLGVLDDAPPAVSGRGGYLCGSLIDAIHGVAQFADSLLQVVERVLHLVARVLASLVLLRAL